MDTLRIPQAIVDLAQKMVDKSLPLHVRNNYRDTLDHIVSAISKEIEKFDKEALVTGKYKRKK